MGTELSIDEIMPHIFWVHKAPSRALDSSNGLLICGPDYAITIDINMPRENVEQMYRFLGDIPHKFHINTHLHLDHITHLHYYQELSSCEIYVPEPDARYFDDITLHRKDFGYDDSGLAEVWMDLVQNDFKFQPVKSHKAFPITEPLILDKITLNPISFTGHGPGHVGFHGICGPDTHFSTNNNQFLFYSDIGIDLGGQQFGPWYGFRVLKLHEVKADVDRAEQLHQQLNIPMLSSHGLLYPHYTPEPYQYIRNKINQREQKIIQAMTQIGGKATVADLMPFDIFYPKQKIKGNLQKLVTYWEEGFLENHLIDLVERGLASRETTKMNQQNFNEYILKQ
jgi:hypothetical protein